MKKITISPSLMCGNLFNLEYDVSIIEAHKFDYLHLDISDGHFVPNIIFGFDTVNRINNLTTIPKDIHLMVKDAIAATKGLDFGSGDLVTFHLESVGDPLEVIRSIREKGAKVGVAINPDTPAESLHYLLGDIDHVLLMCVQPGFAGQQFTDLMYDKADKLHHYLNANGYNISVGVDGAIGFDQIKRFRTAGVSHFVLGTSSLFQGDLNEQARKVTRFMSELDNIREVPSQSNTVYIASDHVGVHLKAFLLEMMIGLGLKVIDLGPNSTKRVNYTDFAQSLCSKVQSDGSSRGVLICGTGIGMNMMANRYSGIRAALCINEYMAEMTRRHNDANILCLGSRVVGESLAVSIVRRFMETNFEGGRHLERVLQLDTART